jgi:hypothetical protein
MLVAAGRAVAGEIGGPPGLGAEEGRSAAIEKVVEGTDRVDLVGDSVKDPEPCPVGISVRLA